MLPPTPWGARKWESERRVLQRAKEVTHHRRHRPSHHPPHQMHRHPISCLQRQNGSSTVNKRSNNAMSVSEKLRRFVSCDWRRSDKSWVLVNPGSRHLTDVNQSKQLMGQTMQRLLVVE
jgi:hypothetical protein